MEFKTVHRPFVCETEEKKSRFIAHVVPFVEFDVVLNKLKKTHRKANHHVTASRKWSDSGHIVENAKDDGEPAGTSGMPVLKVLSGHDLMDVAVIVTRYFGGVKLGTGGLARAYSGAAKAVLNKAELVTWVKVIQRTLQITFEQAPKFEAVAAKEGIVIVSRENRGSFARDYFMFVQLPWHLCGR